MAEYNKPIPSIDPYVSKPFWDGAKEGKLMLEIGHNQSQQVQDLISSNPAYKSYSIIPDLSGIDRFILATARN